MSVRQTRIMGWLILVSILAIYICGIVIFVRDSQARVAREKQLTITHPVGDSK